MISDTEENDTQERIGYVIAVNDPAGRHRVRAKVDNYTDDTGWMSPKTTAGGGLQHGGHVVPREGSRVLITAEMGNPERLVYEPHGTWAETDLPADVAAAGADAHLVQAFEIGQLGPLSFRVTLDERPASRAFRIYAVDTANNDDLIVALELDLVSRAVIIFGLTGVEIRSTGFIQLAAAIIQIQKRPVVARSTPI